MLSSAGESIGSAGHPGHVLRGARALSLLSVLAILAGLVWAPAVSAATIRYVGPSGGGTPGCAAPGFATIQDAVDASASGDTIHICTGTYVLAATIVVDKNLTFEGDGAASSIIDGNAHQIFNALTRAVTFNNLTLTGGTYFGSGGAIDTGDDEGTVTVTNSTFKGNKPTGQGGGAIKSRHVTVTNSTFSGNSVDYRDPADPRDQVDFGGAIYALSDATVTNSTFSGNSADQGGAIWARDNVTVTNSTFSGNLSSSTGAAIELWASSSSRTVTNSVLVQGVAGSNCSDNVASGGGNVGTDETCGGSSTPTADIKLGGLADNGGPTHTMALGGTSVAIDAGDDGVCAAAPVNGLDQRGVSRPQGAPCDAGAFEAPARVGAASTSTVVASPSSVTADGSTSSTVTVTLKDASDNPVSGKSVTLAKSSGPGSPTISAASGSSTGTGVVTFSVTSTTAGADDFTATDTTDGVTVTGTASVTFTAGVATKYLVTSSDYAPNLLSPPLTISAQLADVNDNPVATAGKTVTWTINGTGGSIPSITSTTNADGLATVLFDASHLTSTATVNADGLTGEGLTGTSPSITITQTAQATLVITGPATMTFGASDATITASGGSGSGTLSFGAGTSTACSIVAGKLHVTTAAGTCVITATKAANTDYTAVTSAVYAVTILKASSTVTVTCTAGAPYTYTGSPQTPCTVAVTRTGDLALTPDPTYAANTNAGTATAVYDYAGDDNHAASSNAANFTIGQAAAVVVVTPYAVTYDGSSHTATLTSISGVNGQTGATVGSVDLTGTTHTNAGAYTNDAWSFSGNDNYDDIAGTVDDAIAKAGSTVTVTCTAGAPYTYTGSPQTPCTVAVTRTGDLALTPYPTYTANTDAGTATASYTYAGDDNHAARTDSSGFTILKAAAVIVVTPYAVTFDGSSHTATVTSISGVNGQTGDTVGSVTLSGTTHTNAGTYPGDAWSFSGTPNYTDIAGTTITDEIAKAGSTTVVTCPANVTYTGRAQTPCTVEITGAGGLNEHHAPIYMANTDAGTATASYTYADGGNHAASSGSANFTINKAALTIAGDDQFKAYGSLNPSLTASYSGFVNNDSADVLDTPVALTTTAQTDSPVGSYPITASGALDVNYAIAFVNSSLEIGQASSTTVVTCPADVTYIGSAQTPCTVGVTGAGGLNLTPAPTYAANTNAGTATASYTYAGDVNHAASSKVTANFAILKAAADCSSIAAYSATFDTTGHTATGTCVGVGADGTLATPDLSGTTHTNAGTYAADPWTSTDTSGNYLDASGTVDDAILKADQTITFGALVGQTLASIPVTIGATASSGLAASFSSNTPSVCTVSGSSVSLLTVGDCSISASQDGDADWNAATPVNRTFGVVYVDSTVSLGAQAITFDLPPSGTVGATATLTGSSSSGLALTHTSTTPTVCTVSASTLRFLAAGTCSITASQPGDGISWAAAAPHTHSMAVTVLSLTPVLTDSIAAGVNRGMTGFSTRSVILAKRGYVTFLVRLDPSFAGRVMPIWQRTRSGSWILVTSRLVGADGTMRYFARIGTWTGFWAKLDGGASHARIGTVR